MGVLVRQWEGAIFGKRGAQCKIQGLSAVSCAKMAEATGLGLGGHMFIRIRQVEPVCTSSIVFAYSEREQLRSLKHNRSYETLR